MRKNYFVALTTVISLFLFVLSGTVYGAENSNVNILLNGKAVQFTDDSAYPYVDENNRTMVPLRATMESAEFVVGYDGQTKTAIVITEHKRIEVPIGTNKIYTNNELTENDTIATVKKGRTYLPIRAVLENAGFTVEWSGETKTVNAYTYKYDEDNFYEYSTSSLETLVDEMLKGNVIYCNGKYYATPNYVKMMNNVKVHYWDDDLNTALYPDENDRYTLANLTNDDFEWISGINFGKNLVEDKELEKFGIKGIASEIPKFSYAYVFYDDNQNIIYCVDEITDEFFNAENATGEFNGIRMKKEDNTLYFNNADLKEKNIN